MHGRIVHPARWDATAGRIADVFVRRAIRLPVCGLSGSFGN
jgi:hypothetical protein